MAWKRTQRDPISRFFARIDFDGPVFRGEPCWVWKGALSSAGYGRITVAGVLMYAHRFGYELLVGKIPPGHEIDHLCRRRNCVNPNHLEAVTPGLNRLRGISPAAMNAQKTDCKNGHALTGPNLIIGPTGCRRCRECKRVYERNRYAAKCAR